MRVLAICWAVSDHGGGGEPIGAYEFIRHVARLGVDVDVVSPSFSLRHGFPDNVRTFPVKGGPRRGNTGANKWALLKEVRRLHRENAYDVTHLLTQFTSFPVEWHPFVMTGSWTFPREEGEPAKVTTLDYLTRGLRDAGSLAERADLLTDVAYAAWEERLRGWTLDRSLREADLVVIRQSKGVPDFEKRARRVTHVPLGTDPDTFPFSDAPREPVILYAGHLKPYKNVEAVIRGFARLAPRVPDARLRIVGDGPLRGELEALARSLGVAERVTFLGRIPRYDLVKEYGRAAAFAIPSWEAFGQVCMEAMACGTPVIVSTRNSGAYDYLEEGKNGHMVPPRDYDALASAMERLLTLDDAERRRMSAAARATAERFSWGEIARRYVALYESL